MAPCWCSTLHCARAALSLAAAQADQVAKPTYWRADVSELNSLQASATQLRSVRKPFVARPGQHAQRYSQARQPQDHGRRCNSYGHGQGQQQQCASHGDASARAATLLRSQV